jgi:hypothetical protein
MQESVRCFAKEMSAAEAKLQLRLDQAAEEYSRNLAKFQRLIDSKTEEVRV